MRTSSHPGPAVGAVGRGAARDELVAVVEPIVELATGDPVAVEVLLRPRSFPTLAGWRRSVGVGGSDEVLVLALERAATELAHRRVLVHVNATAGDLEHPTFAAQVLEAVPAEALDRLVVEVTEELPVRHRDAVERSTAELRRRGVRFALDDFGEGWSNFSTVQVLRPEVVKVTTSVLGPHHQPDLAPEIVRFVHDVGAVAVLEQVEDLATLRWARAVGFDQAQGWMWTCPDEAVPALSR